MRILLISEYIAPRQSIATIRWTKLAKYLAKAGHEIVTLTTEKTDNPEKKDVQFCVFNMDFQAEFEKCSQVVFIKNSLCLRVLYTILHTIVPPQGNSQGQLRSNLSDTGGKRLGRIAYFIKDMLTYRSSRAACRKLANEFDVVISSYGPIWVHLSAEYVKRKNNSIVWITDYRDAPSSGIFGPGSRFRLWFVHKHTRRNDAVIGVSSSIVEELHFPDDVPRQVITNGYDPEEVEHRKRRTSRTFDLVYTGTIYETTRAKQDITPLLQALDDLIRDGLVDKADIRVRYAGNSADKFMKQIAGFQRIPHEVSDFVPRDEALALQDKASLLVLLTWNTTEQQGILTGKLFEYMSSGVPIVALVSGDCPGSQVTQVLEETRTGFSYEEARDEEDREALKAFLLDRYQEWKETGLTCSEGDGKAIEKFSHPALAKEVVEIAQSLM